MQHGYMHHDDSTAVLRPSQTADVGLVLPALAVAHHMEVIIQKYSITHVCTFGQYMEPLLTDGHFGQGCWGAHLHLSPANLFHRARTHIVVRLYQHRRNPNDS